MSCGRFWQAAKDLRRNQGNCSNTGIWLGDKRLHLRRMQANMVSCCKLHCSRLFKTPAGYIRSVAPVLFPSIAVPDSQCPMNCPLTSTFGASHPPRDSPGAFSPALSLYHRWTYFPRYKIRHINYGQRERERERLRSINSPEGFEHPISLKSQHILLIEGDELVKATIVLQFDGSQGHWFDNIMTVLIRSYETCSYVKYDKA